MRKGISGAEYRLGVGPMSSEIIEAVFRCSEINAAPLMLIASKNQIDWDGGYVNNWNTKDYAVFLSKMKKDYSKSNVLICRDHCGPNFKSANSGIFDVYKTIDCDIENNFDLIHVDFSKQASDYEGVLNESRKAIEYIKETDNKVLIEVGTDENTGASFKDIEKIEKEVNFFKNFSPIMFYVAQTGSLVKEIEQAGKFNESYAEKVAKTLGGGD